MLCYNLCQSLLNSRSLSNFCTIPDLYADIFLFVLHCAGNVCGRFPVDCIWSVPNVCVHAMHIQGVERGHVGEKKFASVRAQIFWSAIYCATTRPDTNSQSDSWSLMVLGRQSLRIMWEYNLVTMISIQTLNQEYNDIDKVFLGFLGK